ncbi:MAG: 30S ribosomal protein S19e [Nitrososphaerales archaeon]
MSSAYDVPADMLIKRLADYLKRVPYIVPPPWAEFVKTGSHTERPPQEKDWWAIRCASLLRKLYTHGPLGVDDLRSIYGGRKRRGYFPGHHRDAGGAIIRRALQQLEQAGFVKKTKEGRILTDKGKNKVEEISSKIFDELGKENPALLKYRR